MPISFRAFKKELQLRGYEVVRTRRGHYIVMNRTGGKIAYFAVVHGNREKCVLDVYVLKVRKRIAEDEV